MSRISKDDANRFMAQFKKKFPEVTSWCEDLSNFYTVLPFHRVTFTYTNYKGIVSNRDVVVTDQFFYGTTKYHHERALLLKGFCLTKNAMRTFVVKDMSNVTQPEHNK